MYNYAVNKTYKTFNKSESENMHFFSQFPNNRFIERA